VIVVALDGRIVLVKKATRCEKSEGAASEGKKKIVLNMNNITFIDSAGLGTLVASHHTAKKDGASLRLCPWATIPGSAADYQTADGVRCFEHGSRGRGEFSK